MRIPINEDDYNNSDSRKEDEEPVEEENSCGELDKRVEELESQNEEYVDRIKRLQADLENYKKRMMKERKEIIELGTERLVKQLLKLLDDFESALANLKDDDSSEGQNIGLRMMYKQLVDILRGENVSEIETGSKLDPFQHEVVTKLNDPNYQDNDIIECLQKGYKMGDKVIRPARVIVCRREEQAEEELDKDELEIDENKDNKLETKNLKKGIGG